MPMIGIEKLGVVYQDDMIARRPEDHPTIHL